MESDALLILVLCFVVLLHFDAPPWVLLIGGMRYAYIAAKKLMPPLQNPIKERYSRKVVCVIQVVALLLPLYEAVKSEIWQSLLFVSLCLLIFLFGRDIYDQLKYDSRESNEMA